MSVRIEKTRTVYLPSVERYMWICDLCDERSRLILTRKTTESQRELHKQTAHHKRKIGSR